MTPFCEGEAAPRGGKVAPSHLPGCNLTSLGSYARRRFFCQWVLNPAPLVPATSQRVFSVDGDPGVLGRCRDPPSLSSTHWATVLKTQILSVSCSKLSHGSLFCSE